jgi:hypothetical protein
MKRISIRPTTLLICAAVALPLLAAEKLGARVGLWEHTTTTTMGGLALPPELTANMPAAQRAQLEQMMKSQAAPRINTARSCVTEKDLDGGTFQQPPAQQGMQCKATVVSSTSRHQESTFQCTTPVGTAEGKMVVDAIDDAHVKGTMQIKAQQVSIDVAFESKWVSADCAASAK